MNILSNSFFQKSIFHVYGVYVGVLMSWLLFMSFYKFMIPGIVASLLFLVFWIILVMGLKKKFSHISEWDLWKFLEEIQFKKVFYLNTVFFLMYYISYKLLGKFIQNEGFDLSGIVGYYTPWFFYSFSPLILLFLDKRFIAKFLRNFN